MPFGHPGIYGVPTVPAAAGPHGAGSTWLSGARAALAQGECSFGTPSSTCLPVRSSIRASVQPQGRVGGGRGVAHAESVRARSCRALGRSPGAAPEVQASCERARAPPQQCTVATTEEAKRAQVQGDCAGGQPSRCPIGARREEPPQQPQPPLRKSSSFSALPRPLPLGEAPQPDAKPEVDARLVFREADLLSASDTPCFGSCAPKEQRLAVFPEIAAGAETREPSPASSDAAGSSEGPEPSRSSDGAASPSVPSPAEPADDAPPTFRSSATEELHRFRRHLEELAAGIERVQQRQRSESSPPPPAAAPTAAPATPPRARARRSSEFLITEEDMQTQWQRSAQLSAELREIQADSAELTQGLASLKRLSQQWIPQ